MNFIAELQRRKVFKVGAAHVIVAWPAIQSVSVFIFDGKPQQ